MADEDACEDGLELVAHLRLCWICESLQHKGGGRETNSNEKSCGKLAGSSNLWEKVGPGQVVTPYETSWSIIILKDLILGGLTSSSLRRKRH